MKKIASIDEVKDNFDAAIVVSKKDDQWYMLLGGQKNVTSSDLLAACSMIIGFTLNMCDEMGTEDTGDKMLAWLADIIREMQEERQEEELPESK